jgi:hypothetical protein
MKELLIRQLLDELDTQVVQRAEAVVEGMRGVTKELEDKQIRNVMAVAEETQSVAVVDNFIKYQIGRNEDWRFGESGGVARRFGRIWSGFKMLRNPEQAVR